MSSLPPLISPIPSEVSPGQRGGRVSVMTRWGEFLSISTSMSTGTRTETVTMKPCSRWSLTN